jgi:hypothetical protein
MKMRRLWPVAAVVSTWGTIATLASAAGFVSGTPIQGITAQSDGTVIVLFTNIVSGRPACAASTNEMVFSSTTAAGKTLLSVVTSGFLAAKTVNASGTGTCTGPRENMGSITLIP